MSPCFCDAMDKPATLYPPNSSLGSAQNTDMLTSASRLQRLHVLAEVSGRVYIVHGQSASCIVGCKLNLK